MEVTVFERDASAIRGEGKYRGPIQIQSNALAALQAIDKTTAEAVMATGCITVSPPSPSLSLSLLTSRPPRATASTAWWTA